MRLLIVALLHLTACRPIVATRQFPPQPTVTIVLPTPTVEPAALVHKALTYIDPFDVVRPYRVTMTHSTDGGSSTTITEYDAKGNRHAFDSIGYDRYVINGRTYWKYEGKWRDGLDPNDGEFVLQMGLTLIQGHQAEESIAEAIASTGFTVTTPSNVKLITYTQAAGITIAVISYQTISADQKFADVKLWVRLADSLPVRLEANGHLPEFGFFDHFKIIREFDFDTPITITAPITPTIR